MFVFRINVHAAYFVSMTLSFQELTCITADANTVVAIKPVCVRL